MKSASEVACHLNAVVMCYFGFRFLFCGLQLVQTSSRLHLLFFPLSTGCHSILEWVWLGWGWGWVRTCTSSLTTFPCSRSHILNSYDTKKVLLKCYGDFEKLLLLALNWSHIYIVLPMSGQNPLENGFFRADYGDVIFVFVFFLVWQFMSACLKRAAAKMNNWKGAAA